MIAARPIREADDIRETIARIYSSLAPGGAAPREADRGDLDSFAFLEFIEMLEREFGIEIQAGDLDGENFATTASTAAFVRARLAAR